MGLRSRVRAMGTRVHPENRWPPIGTRLIASDAAVRDLGGFMRGVMATVVGYSLDPRLFRVRQDGYKSVETYSRAYWDVEAEKARGVETEETATRRDMAGQPEISRSGQVEPATPTATAPRPRGEGVPHA